MSLWLKQSTAVTVKIGPFVDDTDFKTAETALTISQADIRLSKNGGAFAQSNNATGATHDASGYYGVPLDTTDTNTLGTLRVFVAESGALQVWQDFMVVPANVWDSMFGADLLQVDAREWLGGTIATPTVTGVPEVDLTHMGGVAQSAADLKDFADDGYDPATNKVQGVVLTDTVTTYTGNTVQTGDSFARLGLPAGASVSADIAAIEAQTDDIGAAGAGLTAVPWNAAWDAEVQSEAADALVAYDPPTGAELVSEINSVQADIAALNNLSAAQVNTEVDTAIADARLDELLAADSDIDGAAPPTVGSVFHELLTKTTGSFTYDQTTDSLEAIRDKATDIETDTAEIGAAGAGLTNINLPNQTMDIVGNVTGSLSGSVGSVTGAVASVTAGVTVTTNNDKTGYGLSSAAVQAIWDALTSALTAVGSIGKLLVDNINATISSRLATAGYTAPPTVGAIADQVWEEAIADHSGTSGSTAEALGAAGAAGDPWATAVPGAYAAGTAGSRLGRVPDVAAGAAGGLFIAGTNAATSITTALTANVTGNVTGNLSGSVGSVTGAVGSVTAGVTLAASAVQAIWDALTSALTTVGSIGKLLVDNINAAISSRLASASYTAPPTVGQIADQVWEEAIADHSGTVGSTAEALGAAGSAGDPWSTAVPGAYGAGTAGSRLGRVPDVAAGAAGGLFIAGSNAATTVNVTGNVTGNLSGSVGSVTGTVGSVTAGVTLAASAVQAIWDALTSALTTVGSVGKLLVDNINATISSRATPAQVNTEVDTALADYDAPTSAELVTEINSVQTDLAAVSALVGQRATPAQVNSEMLDVLNVDTFAQPGQEAPPATTTPIKQIGYIYKAFRNKFTQSATEASLFADDGTTVDQKATVSDNGTVFTRNEFTSGP